MQKPKIGLSMLFCQGKPFKNLIAELSKRTNCLVELVDEGSHKLTLSRVAILNEIAQSNDIEFTVHAPFADINIASPNTNILRVCLDRLQKSMSFANDLNAKMWVCHPGSKTGISMFYPEADWKQNVKSIKLLKKIAENYELKLGIENLPEKYGFLLSKPEDFSKLFEGSLHIDVVLDVGHANLENKTNSFFEQIPTKISHLHLSDNFGKADDHYGIGYGNINYNLIASKLKTSGFNGTIIIESVSHIEESIEKIKNLLF